MPRGPQARAARFALAGCASAPPPPPAPPPAPAEPESAAVSPEEMERVDATLRQRTGWLSKCYQEELARRGDKKFAGVLAGYVHLRRDGRADRVEITQDTLGSPEVVDCVAGKIQSWEFGAISAEYPHPFSLAFEPAF